MLFRSTIDGQHGIEAAERTGKPVRYIIVPGYGLPEVQIYNTSIATWKKSDYLQSYSDLGVEPYIKMQEFMESYPEFGIAACEVILTQLHRGSSKTKKVDDGKKVILKYFEEGLLEIPDYNYSCVIADRIKEFGEYYKGFNRVTFVRTILALLKHKEYDHKDMIRKVSFQSTKMVDCTNVEQYKQMLEDIYNYKRKNKISFRYI